MSSPRHWIGAVVERLRSVVVVTFLTAVSELLRLKGEKLAYRCSRRCNPVLHCQT